MPPYSVDADALREALYDRALAQVGDSPLHARLTSPVRIGPLAFTPKADLSVRVLNRPEDKDEDAVFGANGHIAHDVQSAWIKYKLQVSADSRVTLSHLPIRETDEVSLSDYRIHRATDRAWNALSDDLRAPRTVLDLDDVKRLRSGEALALELGGALTVAVTFGWADALSSRFSDLVYGLPLDVPLVLKLKKGLETTAQVKVHDRFAVVVSRTTDGNFRIAVKKVQSRDHTISVDVSFGAEASAVPAIEEVLEPLLEAVTRAASGADEVRVAGILREKLEEELRSRLEKIARWKAATGFAYEYARIDENTAIADFVLRDDSLLADDHAAAMRGDLATLASRLRTDGASRSVIRYLNESSMTRRSSAGFSFGIGKWLDVTSKDESVFRQTRRTSADGFHLITSRGTRHYEESSIPQNDFEWVVDFKAQMTDFAERPSTLDFDYGLHYSVSLERARLNDDDLERMADFASMWDICVPDPSLLSDAVGRKATIRIDVVLDREALHSILATPAPAGSWATPLAMAMPYASMFAERRTFAARADVYWQAWHEWLRGSDLNWITLLRPRIGSGLVALEERALPGSFAWTIGEGHAQLRRRLDSFVRATRRLHDAMTRTEPPQAIAIIYDGLQRFWTDRLYIAASGRWLLERARDAGIDVNRSMRVEYGDTTVVS